ncbi:MAG: hypothetical protein NTX85_04160 [Candidatus Nomurabacteria bacterium]|nr:hypothetical protein [Candidatus Nomurabacteria bacterium]
MLKIKTLNIKIVILMLGFILLILFIFLNLDSNNTKQVPVVSVVKISKIEDKQDVLPIEVSEKEIPELKKWVGEDPYPFLDWDNAKPELHQAVKLFEDKWGKKLNILQVYRPALYGEHIRSVWEIWRYVNDKSFTEGHNCKYKTHIDISKISELNSTQKSRLIREASIHGFIKGHTPPSCDSDHSLGIAVDIVPPVDSVEYRDWIRVANESGLCHYISGDMPHFALQKYLPKDTDCFVR